ncbi:hypothetical protein TRFO_09535 [Tritrichomonas foetus]|uniref:Condensin complex subunit 1 C-terminal domain-containing protein n=1 Tax=Tritrichomonas foetus TaxID=1144522 RepID=A0A1J4JDT7_9EUKA|nr:hypothetical protein TRFO_09535 [Tritrichomonas foetus]|eukprot:OHS97264.1 hypothetical protein TRFO_09535 [Tritrichomonas foetus]
MEYLTIVFCLNRSGMNEDEKSKLIQAIISKEPNAITNFLSSLKEIVADLTEIQHVQLIAFIISWCRLYDHINHEILVANMKYLLPTNSTKHIFLSFFSLFLEIISFSFKFVESELYALADYLKENFKNTFLQTLGFTFLINILDINFYPETVAFIINFISKLMDALDLSNIEKFVESISNLISVSNSMIRISIADSLSSIPIQNEYISSTLNILLNKLLDDEHPTVRIHALFTASKIYEKITDKNIILKASGDKSWKIRMTFLNIFSSFSSEKAFQDSIFTICKSSDPFYRAKALEILAQNIHQIDRKEEMIKIAELSFKVKNEDVNLAALNLLNNIHIQHSSESQSSQTNPGNKYEITYPNKNRNGINKNESEMFHEAFKILKKAKSRKVRTAAYSTLTPFFVMDELEQNETRSFLHMLLYSDNIEDVSNSIRIIGEMLQRNANLKMIESLIKDFLPKLNDTQGFVKKEAQFIVPYFKDRISKELFQEKFEPIINR